MSVEEFEKLSSKERKTPKYHHICFNYFKTQVQKPDNTKDLIKCSCFYQKPDYTNDLMKYTVVFDTMSKLV